HPPPDDGHRAPAVHRRARLPQPDHGPPGHVGGRLLPRGDGRARVPRVARLLEHVPDGRREPPAMEPPAQGRGGLLHDPRMRWVRGDPARGARGGAEVMKLDSKVPEGPIEKKWDKHRFDIKLVNPANKRKYKVIVVGSGLAGSSAAASFAELGYDVACFCY